MLEKAGLKHRQEFFLVPTPIKLVGNTVKEKTEWTDTYLFSDLFL